MNVAVLVKQTPQVSEVKVNDKVTWPETETIVNPFDEYAIEEALRIREAQGGKVVAISYGTGKADSVLRDAIALGADEAYLIADDNYVFLDPQKASLALAAAIKKIGNIQMVLTGKQATDDDSAMMAPAVAGHLDWPQVGFIRKFEVISAEKLICQRSTDEGYDRVEVPLPAVFSVVKEINEPRLPSLKGKMRAKKALISRWSPTEIGVSLEPNSKTKQVSAPPARSSGEILTGTKDEVADKLIAKLKEHQLF